LVNGRHKYYSAFLMALLSMVLLHSAAPAQQDDIQIGLSLDRSQIGLDETATLTVNVTGVGQQQLPEPKLPPLPQFQIFSAGSSTSIQIINGAMTTSMSFNYILSPKREGTFPIRPATMVYNGKRYESNELNITVVKTAATPDQNAPDQSVTDDGKTDDLFLTTEVDKKTAYVDQQVTLSVKLYRAINILSTPDYTPPSTPDFWTNDIPPQRQYYQIINGRKYFIVEERRALFPTKPGELSISPARVTVTVPDRSRRRSRDPFSLFDGIFEQGKEVELRSKPLTVKVNPLPLEGKTDRFSGGVGNYKISADVDKTDVVVNEAITLTVKISGQGNVKSIPEPTLPDIDGFRIEKASSDFKVSNLDDQLGGTKTYEYLLIPRLPGKHSIDPIILNFFDPGQKKYREVATRKIDLSVGKGEGVASSDIPYNMVSGQTINLKETDIRFIKTDDGRLRRRGRILLTSPFFLGFLALPLLVVLGSMIDVKRKRRLANDVGYARHRRANAEAKRRLKTADSFMRSNRNSEFYAELSAALYRFIADKFNVSAHGLTSDKVRDLLQKRSIPDTLLQEILDALKDVDFGRFAGGAEVADMEKLFERVRKTIIDLEGAL